MELRLIESIQILIYHSKAGILTSPRLVSRKHCWIQQKLNTVDDPTHLLTTLLD